MLPANDSPLLFFVVEARVKEEQSRVWKELVSGSKFLP